MKQEAKTAVHQHQIAAFRALHQEDAAAGRDGPPYNKPESRDTHHWKYPQWAGPLQHVFGAHRRGPTRHG